MKLNKQRKAAGLLAVLLVIAMILSLAAPFFTSAQAMTVTAAKSTITPEENIAAMLPAKEIGQDNFLLEVEAGYGNSYILGKPAPLKGVLTNLGSEFKGEIQIKAYTYYNYEGDDKQYTIYYQPIELAKGAKKQVNMNITADAIHKYFQVALINDEGKTVFLKNVAIQAMEPTTAFVGVLTENPQDLAYLSGLKLVENTDGVVYTSKTIYLDENSFPEDSILFENFGIIIVDDFDTKILSTEQKEALKKWVEKGGTLVLGTGAKAEKVLGGLTDLAQFQVDGSSKINSLSSYGYDMTYEDILLAPIEAKGLKEVCQENGIGITAEMPFGTGHIIIHNFSLSSTPFTNISDFAQALRSVYLTVVPSLKVSSYDTQYNDMDVQYVAENFPALKTEGIYIILICLFLYIIILGPVLYYYLKKKDKREWGWVAVPTLAIVFMGIVFFLSHNSLYKSSIINEVSVTDINNVSPIANTNVSVALKAASNGDITFRMEEPIELSFYDSHRGRYQSSGSEERLRKILSGENTEVTFYNNRSWATNNFKTQTSVDLGGNLESTVTLNGNHLSGKIINHTNLDFYGVVIGIAGHFQRFDQLNAGESLNIEYIMDETVNTGTNAYDITDEMYGYLNDRGEVRKRIKEGTLNTNEAYRLYQQKNLIEDSMQVDYYGDGETLEEGILPIIFYAFNDTPVLPQKKYINGELALERTVGFYRSKLELDLSHTKEFDIPFGIIYPTRFESENIVNQDIYSKYMYPDKAGEVDCIYQIPKNVQLSMMQIRNQADVVSFYADPQIFNVKLNNWEPLKTEEYYNIEEYLTGENTIKVRLFINEARDVAMPEMRLKGRGTNAGN